VFLVSQRKLSAEALVYEVKNIAYFDCLLSQ